MHKLGSPLLSIRWDTAYVEIEVPSDEHPELSESKFFFFSQPGLGQIIAFTASPATFNFAFLIFFFFFYLPRSFSFIFASLILT